MKLIILIIVAVSCISCSSTRPPQAPDDYDVDTNTNDTSRYIGIPE